MKDTLNEVCKKLERRGYKARNCKDAEEVVAVIKNEILVDKSFTAGMGNSVTLRALGLPQILTEHAGKAYIRDPAAVTTEDDRKALTADVYFTSANALCLDGRIVNIDNTGNRVAATCFGPKQVVYVIGRNKVVPTLDAAFERAKQAAVKIATHHKRKTPCVKTGKCGDCLSPECVCRVMAIHRKAMFGSSIHVLLVDEDLGL